MNSLYAQINLFTEEFNELTGATDGFSDEGVFWSTACAGCSGSYAVNNGVFENNNTDAVGVWTTDPFDISTCSRLVITIDYEGDPFPGNGNLESNTECITACAGDVNNPTGGGCFNCWDFMDFKLDIDGVFTDLALIGTTNTSTTFQVTYDESSCTGLGNDAFLQVSAQTWGASENMSFDNVMVVCFEDAVSGTLSGMGDLCPGQCTDLDWDVSGGTAPYDLTFGVTAGGFGLVETIPGLPVTGSLTVCHVAGGGIPSFDIGTNTLNLTDFFGTSYQVELINIADNAGCSTALMGQSIDINLVSSPTINSIAPIEICQEIPGPAQLDLSQFDAAIGGGETVEYFSDIALTLPTGPIINVSSDLMVYAIVNVNGCLSNSILINILLSPLPQIDDPGPIESCGEYIIPPITGTNLTTSVGYWTGSGQTGAPIAEGTPITSDIILFIYDEGNGCPAEILFSIDILPQPEIFDLPAVVACGSYTLPPIQGIGLSGFESYHTLPNGGGAQLFPGDVVTENMILYLYDEIGMCSDEVILIVNITDGPSFFMPDSLVACNTVLLPPIDGDGLSGNASYFSGQDGTGIEFPPGSNVDASMTLYLFDESGDCSAEQAIEIVVIVGPTIGTPLDTVECEFYVLPEAEGSNLMNPTYLFQGNTLQIGDTVTQSGVYTLIDSISEDIFEFNGFPLTCAIGVDFNITIIELPNAGNDVAFNDCGGSMIDLNDVLPADADNGGMFVDPLNTGVITGNTLDGSLVVNDSFDFLYIVESMCGIDTANYQINITDNANAGDNTSTSVCENEEIDLIDFISNADPGGVFVNTIDQSMPTSINTNIVVDAGGSILFLYIVGQGGTCDPDTSNVNFVIIETPMLDLATGETSCSAIELPDINGINLSGNEEYNTEPDGSGTSFEPGDSLFNSTILYVQSGVGLCAALDSVEYVINIAQPTFIDEITCSDDTITVNGEQFFMGKEMGTQTFTTMDGCDSIVEISLSFYEIDTNFITQEVCWGGEFSIFGVTLDADQSSVQLDIPNIGQNGCDSIIFVNLLFDDPLTRNVNASICENDSILINGIFYSADNPSGTDTVFVQGECDTILFVNVSLEESVNLLINDTICMTESIVIGNETFDIDNPTGEVMLTGSGCDSLIMVDLSFFDEAIGMLTGNFCADAVIDTLGEIFTIDNPEMEVVLQGASAQSCDSTVFVSFTFNELQEGFIDTVVCEAVDVIIGGQIFNESNSSGQVSITTDQGCDSIINVTYSLEPVVFDYTVFDGSCADENGFIVLNGVSQVASSYSYDLDFLINGTIEIGDTIFGITPGDHMIIFSANGMDVCTDEENFTILQAADFGIDIPSEVTIEEGEVFSLDIPDIDDFIIAWLPPTGISCVDCSNPEFSPTETTEYVVVVSDGANCTATDTILIRVETNFDIYMPNVFSPNQDGVNDRFLVFSENDVLYDMNIYDRWGNRVYEGLNLITNDTSMGWDGMSNNSNVAQGVYVYKVMILIDETAERLVIDGTITIVR